MQNSCGERAYCDYRLRHLPPSPAQRDACTPAQVTDTSAPWWGLQWHQQPEQKWEDTNQNRKNMPSELQWLFVNQASNILIKVEHFEWFLQVKKLTSLMWIFSLFLYSSMRVSWVYLTEFKDIILETWETLMNIFPILMTKQLIA